MNRFCCVLAGSLLLCVTFTAAVAADGSVAGLVKEVDAKAGTITMTTRGEKAREEKPYTVAKDVKVLINGQAKTLKDVTANSRASVKVNKDKKVTEITVRTADRPKDRPSDRPKPKDAPKSDKPRAKEGKKVPGRQFYVDNVRGDDKADGSAPKLVKAGVGPVKTLARAVSLLKAGDTLHMSANATPYRETLQLNDVSGEPGNPITFDGHGAVIEGCDPLGTDWVKAGPGLYKSEKLLARLPEFNEGSKLQRVFFLFAGAQQRMGRTSKGAKAPFKKPGDLKPGEWTFVAATKTFYVKVKGELADAKVEVPARRNGVAIMGRKDGVNHIVIRNLMCQHVLNDGFNLHGKGTDIVFENIAAYENGDEGLSPHETIECSINGFWSCKNADGLGCGYNSVTNVRNAWLEGNYSMDFAVGHSAVVELRDSVIVTSEARATPIKIVNAQDCHLTLDNVQISGGSASQVIQLAGKTKFTARRVTAFGPSWKLAGAATVSQSVFGGRRIECGPGGSWKGEKNIYDTAMKLTGIEEENKTLKKVSAELFKTKGQPFPSTGADPTVMKLPRNPMKGKDAEKK